MTLISKALVVSGSRIAALACAALLGVLTARFLGPAGRGIYALPLLDAGLAITFAAGLSTAMSYFLLNKKSGNSIVRPAVVAIILYTLLGAVCTTLTAALSHSLWAVLPGVICIPLYAFYALSCGYFIGRDRVNIAAFINFAMYVVTLLLVAIALQLKPVSPLNAIGAMVASMALVSCAAVLAVWHNMKSLNGGPTDIKAFLTFVGKAGSLNLVNLLNYRVDAYVVAAVAPLPVLGLYSVAVAGAESALSLAQSVIQVTVPRMGSKPRTEAGPFAAKCIRNSVFLAAVLCTLGIVVAAPVVGILFGPAYLQIVPALRILLVGVIVVPIGTLVSNYFMLNLGRSQLPLGIAAISSLICGGVSFILVPKVGIVGAAIGSTTGYLVSQAVAVTYFCKETGISARKVLVVDRSDAATYKRIVTGADRAA